MPLRHGSSRKVISENIEELLHTYKETGEIGSTKPRNMKHAQKIASAIAYRKARESRKGKKRRKR